MRDRVLVYSRVYTAPDLEQVLEQDYYVHWERKVTRKPDGQLPMPEGGESRRHLSKFTIIIIAAR